MPSMTVRGLGNSANWMASRKPAWWPWPAAWWPWPAAGGPRRAHPLDLALAGRQGGGTGFGRLYLPGDGPAGTEKNELKPWQKKEWCIPEVSADFVACMEDVLDLYDPVCGSCGAGWSSRAKARLNFSAQGHPMTPSARWSASTRPPSSWWQISAWRREEVSHPGQGKTAGAV